MLLWGFPEGAVAEFVRNGAGDGVGLGVLVKLALEEVCLPVSLRFLRDVAEHDGAHGAALCHSLVQAAGSGDGAGGLLLFGTGLGLVFAARRLCAAGRLRLVLDA